MNFSYYMPTRIFFGPGSVAKLSKTKLPGRKALIITGGTSTVRHGYVDKVQTMLKMGGAESILYHNVQPNPTIQNVNECAEIIAKEGCDFVVGLGGGSSIDTAKATSVKAANPGDYWDYVFGGSGKGLKMPNDPLPIIAITTTAGTGTEADPWAVITNGEEKIGFGNDKTFPAIAIVDPAFMSTVPPRMTAYQGFDALFHAVEGYIAKIANPMSDMFALQSISLIGKSLTEAVNRGDNMDARADIALANTLSGFVETLSSCTSEHGIEHALSALHPDLPHGAGLIMVSLAYHEAMLEACPERYVEMARALGKENASDPHEFLDALAELQKACGVDNLKMSAYRIDADDLGKYADNALFTMGGLFRLDRKRLTREDVIAILEKSYR